MPLPVVTEATYDEVRQFDRKTGQPAALNLLRKRLGLVELARFSAAYVMASRRDVLAGLPTDALSGFTPAQERLVRRQLRSAFMLDDALQAALPGWKDADRIALTRDVIAETGARFVEANIPLPQAADWFAATTDERAGYLRSLQGRMFNALMGPLTTEHAAAGFDVTACRFAQLTRLAGRQHLATAFCEADSRYFATSGLPIRFERGSTIAAGAPVCDFRFRFQAR